MRCKTAFAVRAEELFFLIFEIGGFISIENPERSWLWALLAELVKKRKNKQP